MCGRGKNERQTAGVRPQPKLDVSGMRSEELTWGSLLFEAPLDARRLSSQQPHGPAGYNCAAQKHHEAIQPVAHHIARGLAVRDSEHDRRKQSENNRRAEVVEGDGQGKTPGFKVSEFQGFKDKTKTANP